MREKRNFAERTKISKEDRTRKKYFLVFEGSRTEEIYFDTINELKGKIGINPLIEIISIERTYSEYGWSNPKKILEQLLKDLEEIEDEKLSYKTLVDKIMEIIVEDKRSYRRYWKWDRIFREYSKKYWRRLHNSFVYYNKKSFFG